LTKDDLIADFKSLGLVHGDTVLIRADLGAVVGVVSRIPNFANMFIDALSCVVSDEGTIISLSFTKCSLWPDKNTPFRADTPTNSGSLPQKMLKRPGAKRSRHPTCSFVALGKHAEFITAEHGPDSPAYEPVRKIIELGGKMVLVGCVSSNPGFTTAHLAEYDLGMMKKLIFPWLFSCFYESTNGEVKIFRRTDPGLCSNSYFKFYSYYVTAGILRSAFVGYAYSIMVPSKEAYAIEKQILSNDPKFNICGKPDCFICNAWRWDSIYRMPEFIIRRIIKKYIKDRQHSSL
jgi:aminoglycoside N3'-acetyltransferase